MKRPLLLLATACCAIACTRQHASRGAPAAAVQPTPVPTTPGGADKAVASTRLTIYSGEYDALQGAEGRGDADMPGYALADSRLHYALTMGKNVISFARLPRSIDVAAIALHPEGAGISIDGQRFLAPPANAEELLASAIGRRVSVEHTSGGAKQTDNGVLVAAGDSLTLALGDGRTKVIHQYDNFSLLDADQQPTPERTLRWQVDARQAGDATFDLSYPTGGLAWRAEYQATLAHGDGCKLALDGAAMVANRSGIAWPNVALTLVAGSPNLVRANQPAAMGNREFAAAPPPPPMPQARNSGEYYAYPLPAKATLADDSIERVPLFTRIPAVNCERAYETTPSLATWQPPQPILDAGFNDDTGKQAVKVVVSLANDKASGLGQPLPAGRVRVFDGGDFLGESAIPHTATGGHLDLDVGSAFDLSAERSRTDFKVDRAGHTMSESFSIVLANAKQTPVNVMVIEPLPRWTDWEVLDSSVPATRRDAQHARFNVPVPAGGNATLRYTVRYSWTGGVTP